MFSQVSLPLVLGAAVVDAVNPCAFAVLIFLIMYLLAMKDRRKMLAVALLYVAAVYVVYFSAGIGLLSFVKSIHLTRFFYFLTALLSIGLGVLNIYQAATDKRGSFLQIPESRKPLLQKYMRRATLPAALILGFLVAIFELPCTGGVYLAILSMLADRASWLIAVMYLLIYNFVFVLPLLVIIFIAYYGLPPEKLENWRRERRLTLRLSLGIFLILLGALMLFL